MAMASNLEDDTGAMEINYDLTPKDDHIPPLLVLNVDDLKKNPVEFKKQTQIYFKESTSQSLSSLIMVTH